jgi:hypothetical protein
MYPFHRKESKFIPLLWRKYMAKDIYQKPIDSSHNSNVVNNTPNVAQPSMGQAIRELPGQYFKVLTRPSVNRFVEEKGKARWSIVWVQLMSLAIIDAILQSVSLLISPNSVNSLTGVNNISPLMLQTITIITVVLFQLVLTPVSFLAAGGILYLIARAFGGRGHRSNLHPNMSIAAVSSRWCSPFDNYCSALVSYVL